VCEMGQRHSNQSAPDDHREGAACHQRLGPLFQGRHSLPVGPPCLAPLRCDGARFLERGRQGASHGARPSGSEESADGCPRRFRFHS